MPLVRIWGGGVQQWTFLLRLKNLNPQMRIIRQQNSCLVPAVSVEVIRRMCLTSIGAGGI